MTYKEVSGDVVDVAESVANTARLTIIPHVCNSLGVMGAGVARRLVTKWPGILRNYADGCNRALLVGRNRVGWNDYVAVKNNSIEVVNMVAQVGVGRSNRIPLRYGALAKCMHDLLDAYDADINIVAPKFGSALAGGNWEVIRDMIEEIWVDNGVDVTVVVYKGCGSDS